MFLKTNQIKYYKTCLLAICLFVLSPWSVYAQDTSSKLLDLNQNKIIKKINALLDSSQKKIKNDIYNKANEINESATNSLNNVIKKVTPAEEERPLPYELLLNKKYNLGRRAYQNTVAQYNYLFYAGDELNELIQKARTKYQEDYSSLLSFYDYDLSDISKASIDSIIYRCNANIVLHDLRSNWVDDSYLLLAKAYLFHKNYDTAGSILQFINYSFDEKIDGMDMPIGSNLRQVNGKFSIANRETNRVWENVNIRNESMVWQARNYFESNALNEGLSLLQLLKGDALFPKRLYPFLNEQLAYGYYLMESYENAANYLEEALPNAEDNYAKSRWYFLIAQMWQKANNIQNAYKWYKKANEFSPNPLIGVYAKINMVRIEAKNTNRSWEILANDLLQLIKKEKYKPYADIIYFEMAKLAIQNKVFDKANKWLITSITANYSNTSQKQQSFELLGEINYQIGNYAIAKIAYDSLTNVLKSNPQYETIQLRKKWMSTISEQSSLYQNEDSLQRIYLLPQEYQQWNGANYEKRMGERKKEIANLFKESQLAEKNVATANTKITTTFSAINNSGSDFYFLNSYNLTQGKQQFIQKWGERPNVDTWRRKTSANMTNALTKLSNTSTISTAADSIVKTITKENTKDSAGIQLLSSPDDYSNSQKKWNAAALLTAQTFLLKLNDFEKAKPLYQKIINKHIEPATTERALLDLASQYLHEGKNETSDSLILIVTKAFPNGDYIKKKSESENKKNKSNQVLNNYKEFYFLGQIGNWNQMSQMANKIQDEMKNTKWYTPYQFLKVKMYAQQKQDSLAFKLLDTILQNNKSELIKEKAKNIVAQLNDRNKTETYLTGLEFTKEALNQEKEPQGTYQIAFKNDSLDKHYIAIATHSVKPTDISKMQVAFQNNNKLNFPSNNLNTTFAPLEAGTYLIWIGPFDNVNQSIKYLDRIKPKLTGEIIPFIPQQQYEIYIFGKSNIELIKDNQDLKLYKEFMIHQIYKP